MGQAQAPEDKSGGDRSVMTIEILALVIVGVFINLSVFAPYALGLVQIRTMVWTGGLFALPLCLLALAL